MSYRGKNRLIPCMLTGNVVVHRHKKVTQEKNAGINDGYENIGVMGLFRVLLPDSLFESHKKVTLKLTREKEFKNPYAGKPFVSTISRNKATWHLICMSSGAR